MMSSRMSLNGMGLFEGSPEEKTSPFVMFNRVQAVPGRTPPAWGRRRTLRAKVVSGDRIKFVSVEIPQIYAGEPQKFKAMGKKPLPGDFPQSILPYNRAGWDFVEPHPSAQGLGEEEKSTWSAITEFAKTAVEKGKEFAPLIKIFKKSKKAQDTSAPAKAPAPTYQPSPPEKTNYLPYILIGGGVLLVGGLVTVLVLKR